jgi:hypothetical protein
MKPSEIDLRFAEIAKTFGAWVDSYHSAPVLKDGRRVIRFHKSSGLYTKYKPSERTPPPLLDLVKEFLYDAEEREHKPTPAERTKGRSFSTLWEVRIIVPAYWGPMASDDEPLRLLTHIQTILENRSWHDDEWIIRRNNNIPQPKAYKIGERVRPKPAENTTPDRYEYYFIRSYTSPGGGMYRLMRRHPKSNELSLVSKSLLFKYEE